MDKASGIVTKIHGVFPSRQGIKTKYSGSDIQYPHEGFELDIIQPEPFLETADPVRSVYGAMGRTDCADGGMRVRTGMRSGFREDAVRFPVGPGDRAGSVCGNDHHVVLEVFNKYMKLKM